jgi:hypothetical protein
MNLQAQHCFRIQELFGKINKYYSAQWYYLCLHEYADEGSKD